MSVGIPAGHLDEPEDGDLLDLDEIEFDDDEIEAAMGRSPLDDIGGADEDDDQDATHDEGEAAAAEGNQANQGEPTDGQPRDEQGRFKPKDDQPGESPAPQDGTPAPAATAAGSEGEAPAITAATSAAPIEEPAEPVRFRAGGKVHEIAGSRVTSEGIFIPREQQERTLQLLNRGTHYEETWPQQLRELNERVQRAESTRSEKEARFTGYLSHLEGLIDQAEAGDEEPLMTFIEDFRRNLPRWRAEAALAAAKVAQGGGVFGDAGGAPGGNQGHAQATDEGDTDDVGRLLNDLGVTEEEFERKGQATLKRAMEQAREVPQYMGVSDEARDAAYALIEQANLWGQYIGVATRDDPANGVTRGQFLVNTAALGSLMMAQQAQLAGLTRRMTAADKAAAANAQRGVATRPNGAPAPAAAPAAPNAVSVPLLPAEGDREAHEQWMRLPLSVREASSRQGRRAPKGKWSREAKG
jgi:hypothetical protein